MYKSINEAIEDIVTFSLKKEPLVHSVKNIKVSFEKDKKNANLDIYIIVKFGAKIPEVAWNVQNIIKESFKKMKNINFKEINIHVSGVEG